MPTPPSLTPDAILALNGGNTELRPVLQVLDIRQIGTAQAVQERYRMVLSDGTYVQQAMLATQLNDFVKSGHVQKGTVVQLVEYICNTVQQRRIIIVLSMQVVEVNCDIIGNPKQIISTEQLVTGGADSDLKQPHQQKLSTAPSLPPAENGMSSLVLPANNNSMGYSSYTVSTLPRPPQSNGFHGQGVNASGIGVTNIPNEGSYGRPAAPPMYGNRGSIVKNEAPARIVPIAALNPYQGRWTIKARVTSKSDLRRFNNAKGEGKVFSFDLLDAECGEIRVTCFNTVADQFYNVIDVGKVYLIAKGSLKAAQKSFNHLKNEWEIFLESTSTVQPCFDKDDSIPSQKFDFRPIGEIESMEENSMADVIGVVATISPTTSVMRKNGTETQKRTLQLRDMSGRSVELTMWGAFCSREGQYLQELCDKGQCPVLAVKAGRISDFGGKSIGTITSSQLLINPDLPKAAQLKQWFECEGKNSVSQSLSHQAGSSGTRIETRRGISQIKEENLGRSEKPDWIVVKVTISFIKVDNFCYTACPLLAGDRQCNKKVVSNGDGTWRCDRCEKSIPDCDYRYLLSLQVQDHTGGTWITAFQETGEEITGVSAKELYMWKQDENQKFGALIQSLLFSQYLFKLKVKEENYNDELRVKCTVVKADRLDFSSESKILLELIRRLSRGEITMKAAVAATPTPMLYSGSLNGVGLANAGGYASPFTSSGSNQMQRWPSYGNVRTPYATPSGGPGINYSAYGSSNNAYGGSGDSCFKCGRGGHLPMECPSDRHPQAFGSVGVVMGGGGNSSCFKCGQGGHWARDCTSQATTGGPAGRAMGNNPGYGGNYGHGRGF